MEAPSSGGPHGIRLARSVGDAPRAPGHPGRARVRLESLDHWCQSGRDVHLNRLGPCRRGPLTSPYIPWLKPRGLLAHVLYSSPGERVADAAGRIVGPAAPVPRITSALSPAGGW